MRENPNQKIPYLEGLRGIAALAVLFAHFACTFYPAAVLGDPALTHVGKGAETWVATTPLNVVLGGELAVCIFFVLSGYVLSAGFFARPSRAAVAASFFKRYVRLEGPILFSVLFGWLLLALGLFFHLEVVPLTNSGWVRLFYGFEPNFLQALRHAFVDVFVLGRAAYDPVLWTMRIELLGSYLVYVLLIVFGTSRARLVAYPIAIVCLIQSYYWLFVVGMLISALHEQATVLGRRRSVQRVAWALLVVALLLGSYPYYFDAAKSWWRTLATVDPLTPRAHLRVAAALLLVALALLPRLQALLSTRVALFLGRISFSLYLLHLPILLSFSCLLFRALHPYAAYNVCGVITFAFTLGIVLLASVGMTRYVDEPSIALSRMLAARILEAGRAVLARVRRRESPWLASPTRWNARGR